jgi:hypothetical protein
VSNQQDVFNALVSSMGQVNGPLGVEERSTCFLNEYFAGVGETDYTSLLPLEKMKTMVFFEFVDLLAERRLADTENLGSSCNVQLVGQNDHGVQVARVNVREHIQTPRTRLETPIASSQKRASETRSGYSSRTQPGL